MNQLITGALAGLAATAPMTLAMEVMHRYLPTSERYPLPPRLITEKPEYCARPPSARRVAPP